MITLYHKNKKGVLYVWQIWTEGLDVVTEYGIFNGKKQNARFACESKNIGKANETSPEEQAISEMNSIIQNKLDKKYKRTVEETEEATFGPMLASSKKFEDYKDKLVFPVYAESKIDGLRCLAYWNEDNTEILMMSRGKEFYKDLTHITDELKHILPYDSFFDGELYVHGEKLQTINSYVKKYKEGLTEKIQYWIYDFCYKSNVAISGTFEDRLKKINHIFLWYKSSSENLIEVKATKIESLEELIEYNKKNLEAGFEGSIIRKLSGIYLLNQRSNDLLKYKLFQDDEFEVVGYTGGKGKNLNCVTWECKTKEGNSFTVQMNDTYETQEEYLENADKYVGEKLTVQFFNYTIEGKPFLPRGLHFRIEEDLEK